MKKFTTCNTSDKKKRHILRMLPVLTAAGALSIALTGCGTSSEDEYSVIPGHWQLQARKIRSHRFLQKNSLRKFLI